MWSSAVITDPDAAIAGLVIPDAAITDLVIPYLVLPTQEDLDVEAKRAAAALLVPRRADPPRAPSAPPRDARAGGPRRPGDPPV